MKFSFFKLFSLFFLFPVLSSFFVYQDDISDPWFRINPVAEKVWLIDDNGVSNIYLVEGTDSALLIDTGIGIGDLKSVVRKISALPVIVVNTHGHVDHTGCNYQFEKVYAHPSDTEKITACFDYDFRQPIIAENAVAINLSEDEIEKTARVTPSKLCPVSEGYVFDLGGRKLQVIEVPGHTRGSICLLDSGNRMIFSGDHNNQLVWLFLKECDPLEVYLQSLEKLRNFGFDTIMPGHGQPLTGSFLDEQIACAKNILEGSCTPEEYHSFDGESSLCRFQSAAIAYDPGNLREKE